MKRFKANVLNLRDVEFSVLADSQKEAVRMIKTIIEKTDLLERTSTECSVSVNVTEDEPCDGDCDNCFYSDEDEYLLDELY